jgi:pimeloyl-ACP methyl ester carboxylesterase
VSISVLLGDLVALVVLVVPVGMAYQTIGSARDKRRFPPPGQMVDVGGYCPHIHSIGEGSPTVVFESALGSSSLSWALVHSDVAKFTRACSYDRAGLGWSGADPMPRTAQRIVKELHTLLTNARTKGPYVLVGHSFGRLTARLYAAQYPEEVVGMVLVDPADPSQWLQMTAGQRKRLETGARLSRRGGVLARLGIARLIAFLVSAGALGIARFSVSLVSGDALNRVAERILAPVKKLPSELWPMLRAIWVQPKFFEALASEMEYFPESAAQVAATGDYGDIPLVVLSAGDPTTAQTMEQEAVARLSSNGKIIIVPNSGHWIQLDQPQFVIDAIREVLQSARR